MINNSYRPFSAYKGLFHGMVPTEWGEYCAPFESYQTAQIFGMSGTLMYFYKEG